MRPGSAVVAILVGIVWGLCFVLIKASLPSPAPLLLAGVRALIGGAVLGSWVVLRPGRPPRATPIAAAGVVNRWADSPRNLWLLIALALANGTLALGSMYLAAEHAEAGTASILSAGQPLILAAAGWFIFGERISSRTAAGLTLAMAGVILVAMASSETTTLEGIALALVATAAPAIGTILMRRLGSDADLPLITSVQFLLGGAFLLAASVATEPWTDLAWPVGTLISLLVLGVLGTGVAYVAWFWLISRVSLVSLSTALFLVPAVGVVASIASGERPAPLELAGMAALFVGIATVALGGFRPPRRVSVSERA
jgi:probable blue pigment (indigoidine) exporter